jgi:hypothetical protein
MGPVGYDIGCGVAALRSAVPRDRATPDRMREFSRKVMERVGLGAGSRGETVSPARFQEIVRGGAEALGFHRGTAERDRIPVEDAWDIPRSSRAWRGQSQLGSLGGGNHFIELQHDGERLYVMFHEPPLPPVPPLPPSPCPPRSPPPPPPSAGLSQPPAFLHRLSTGPQPEAMSTAKAAEVETVMRKCFVMRALIRPVSALRKAPVVWRVTPR